MKIIPYIAFLRAINVGGSKIIKMTDLKDAFNSLKLDNVNTYIQSGNVLFGSPEKDTDLLRHKIEEQLIQSFGFKVTTILRTRKGIEDIIINNPFSREKLSKDLMLYIAFLTHPPAEASVKNLSLYINKDEKFVINRDNVFCLISKKVKTQFSNNWLEKKLSTEATTRNFTTILKIYELFNNDPVISKG